MNVIDFKKKLSFRTLLSLLVLTAVILLGRGFLQNWQKINIHEWQFNYWFLGLSLVFFVLQTFFVAIAWRKILLFLEPQKTISWFLALRIHVFALFGKYLPGISWAPVAKLYFGKQSEFSNPKLAVSVIYENLISIVSGFVMSLFLLSVFYKFIFHSYFASVAVIIVGLILASPRVFYSLARIATNLLKSEPIPKEEFLKTSQIIKLSFYYFLSFGSGGIGLYFLINSILHLSVNTLPVVVGAYALAIVSGVVVLVAPAGLGVREGILVLIFSSYFSLETAVFLSVLARVWTTVAEIASFAFVASVAKLRKLQIT